MKSLSRCLRRLGCLSLIRQSLGQLSKLACRERDHLQADTQRTFADEVNRLKALGRDVLASVSPPTGVNDLRGQP